jgi:hypothetical protein
VLALPKSVTSASADGNLLEGRLDANHTLGPEGAGRVVVPTGTKRVTLEFSSATAKKPPKKEEAATERK